MKFTRYFQYTRNRPDRKIIKNEWIKFVIENPIKEVIKSDGRVKRWAKIEECNKSLEIIEKYKNKS